MRRVAAIVVTYNKKNLLLESIAALLNQTVPIEIIVVDNNSSDGTFEALQPYFKNDRVHYFNTNANLGGAGGFHFGISKAFSLGFDYVWLMDDDAVPKENALEMILKATESLNDGFGFLCSNVRYKDGNACKMNIPKINEGWLDNASLIKDGLLRVDRATFVGFFVSMNTIQLIGLPIKEFFIWSDDTEYSHRINATSPCYLVLDSEITHNMAVNESANIVCDSGKRLDRYYYAFRNRHYIARNEGWEGRYLLRILRTSLEIMIYSDDRIKRLLVMYRGCIAGFFFHPTIDYLSS